MADWKTFAKNNVPARDWTHLRQTWTAAAIGFQYGTVSSLEDSVESILGTDFETFNPNTIFDFRGKDVAALHDAVESALRGAYILSATQNCLLAGQPSWASLDAYHCSLVFCRAILGLLGIYFVRIKDTNCVLDVFPEGSDAKAQRKFRSQHRHVADPVHVFYRKRGSLIEQAGIWALLVRALRMTSLPSSLEATKTLILDIDEGFGRARNDILYNNYEWPFSPDMLWPISVLNLSDDLQNFADLKHTFSSQRDANFALCKAIVSLAIGLINDIGPQAGAALLPSYYGNNAIAFRTFKAASI